MIKAIFLDFDSTLYSHVTDKIPDSAFKAINLLREKGIKVFISTGRSKSELDWFDTRGLIFDGYIFNNGQLCFAEGYEKIVYANVFEGELKKLILDLFTEKRLPVMICEVDDVYINTVNEHIKKVQFDVGSIVPEVKEYNGKDFVMAAVYFTSDEDKDKLMAYKDRAEITYWHAGAVDIVPKGSSKSSGIDKIIDYYNIDISETMSVGDGENDIAMIKHSGIGVAMGNSVMEVKNVADYITDDIDDDGLYKAFKHYGLI